MSPIANKSILITGASAGIGAAAAVRLARAGARVFGTSRRPKPSEAGVTMLPMDVRDAASIAACVGEVIKATGRIDALVNNAGYGIAASVEDTTVDDMMRQLDTNFLGPLRVVQAVLPHMRARGSGRIVQVSSLAARIGIPFQGAYSASKSALSGISEALSLELVPFGIAVVLVEPGDTKTNFTAMREWTGKAKTSDVYGTRARHAVAVMEKSEQRGTPADKVARLIQKALTAEKPKLRYVSASASERLALLLQSILPGRSFEAVIGSNYELPKR
ncbi:MAG: SDR family oxidoreductase [Rhizomicrobium sp.]|jgi:NAD(P)-dependent dehydrogenase (short-subunit alcohol dehydrogenase family)